VGGGAAVGVGLVTVLIRRWLLPAITRRISRSLTRSSAPKSASRTALTKSPEIEPAVYEQVIWIRRIIIRR
jgi:hypothetical protein